MVIATKEGREIARVSAAGSKLAVRDVEKVVAAELKTREPATARAQGGDAEGEERRRRGRGRALSPGRRRRCSPSLAKKANKALDRMGQSADAAARRRRGADAPKPDLSARMNRRMTRLMEAGLAAERRGDLETAQRSYEQAHALDPGDAVAMRFLGELHRHHTGDWERATEIFQTLLERPADRLSRAVALHGLGKMTIHRGEFGAASPCSSSRSRSIRWR